MIASTSASLSRAPADDAGRKRSPAKKNADWACASLPCPMMGWRYNSRTDGSIKVLEKLQQRIGDKTSPRARDRKTIAKDARARSRDRLRSFDSDSSGFSRTVRGTLRRERIVITLFGSKNCRFDVKVDYLVELRRASQGAFGRFASFTSALTFPSMQRQFWSHFASQESLRPFSNTRE